MPSESEKSAKSDPDQWQRFRDLMPITSRFAYFDHAAVAPLPLTATRAMSKWMDEAASQGDAVWPSWSARLEELRGTVATSINAEAAEIALVPNTTAGLNILAEGYPWQSGDNVVTLANEFPSNLYPWMHLADRGVTTRQVAVDRGRVDLGRVADACDERTRVVSLSWVGYASGWRIDVANAAAVAHQHGAIFCLDAIQGLGVYPLDVQAASVDFLAADGHKWLLGPEGAGVCYVSRQMLERLRPTGVGWNSVEGRYDFGNANLEFRQTAARYEGGSMNMVGFHGLAGSVDLLAKNGFTPTGDSIANRVIYLADYACERLGELGCFPRFDRENGSNSAIVTFEIPDADPTAIRSACFEANVIVSCRGGGIRVAAHAYNMKSDIDRLVDVVRRFI